MKHIRPVVHSQKNNKAKSHKKESPNSFVRIHFYYLHIQDENFDFYNFRTRIQFAIA
jgi:hypothetical protein